MPVLNLTNTPKQDSEDSLSSPPSTSSYSGSPPPVKRLRSSNASDHGPSKKPCINREPASSGDQDSTSSPKSLRNALRRDQAFATIEVGSGQGSPEMLRASSPNATVDAWKIRDNLMLEYSTAPAKPTPASRVLRGRQASVTTYNELSTETFAPHLDLIASSSTLSPSSSSGRSDQQVSQALVSSPPPQRLRTQKKKPGRQKRQPSQSTATANKAKGRTMKARSKASPLVESVDADELSNPRSSQPQFQEKQMQVQQPARKSNLKRASGPPLQPTSPPNANGSEPSSSSVTSEATQSSADHEPDTEQPSPISRRTRLGGSRRASGVRFAEPDSDDERSVREITREPTADALEQGRDQQQSQPRPGTEWVYTAANQYCLVVCTEQEQYRRLPPDFEKRYPTDQLRSLQALEQALDLWETTWIEQSSEVTLYTSEPKLVVAIGEESKKVKDEELERQVKAFRERTRRLKNEENVHVDVDYLAPEKNLIAIDFAAGYLDVQPPPFVLLEQQGKSRQSKQGVGRS